MESLCECRLTTEKSFTAARLFILSLSPLKICYTEDVLITVENDLKDVVIFPLTHASVSKFVVWLLYFTMKPTQPANQFDP